MKVLVAYASALGATQGIAERIGQVLSRQGLEVDVRDVEAVVTVGAYDAFVVGSAVHGGHWLPTARDFVVRERETLARRPTWLFSSGPVGDRAVAAPQPDPKEVAAFRHDIHPRQHEVFAGAFDRETADMSDLGFVARTVVRRFLPDGDWRNWDAIEGWADGIARSCRAMSTVGARA